MHVRLLISLCLTLALCGCAGVAAPTPTLPPPTPIATIPARTATPTATPTRGPQPLLTTVRLWLPEELSPYGQRPGASVLAQQLAAFSEAYPELRVEVVVKKAHGRGGLLDFLRTARDVAPTVLPDLVVMDAADLETAAAAELVQPLDELLSPATASNRFAFASTMGDMQGRVMGFVIGVGLQHGVYRPELFSAPPISWTAVISAPSPFIFAAGGHERRVNEATLMQYLAAGGALTDDGGRPTLEREPLISVFGFYSSCITSRVISPTALLSLKDEDAVWAAFQAGEGALAVVPAGRYWLEADRTLVAPVSIPTRDGQPFTIVTSGWAIALVAQDPARQGLAMLLLDWLIAPDHSAQWTQAAGYLPSTQSALQLWNVSDKERAVLLALLDVAQPPPPPEAMATSGQVLQEALEALLRGRATPRQAANLAIESLGR